MLLHMTMASSEVAGVAVKEEKEMHDSCSDSMLVGPAMGNSINLLKLCRQRVAQFLDLESIS